MLVPSLEREIRRELTHKAENHAVVVFARNLRSKLLAAPLRGKRVLAIDPAFRTGCKLAVLDETGNLLADGVIFPHAPQNKKAESKARLEELVCRHQVSVIAIGNGTACRETEELVSELLAHLEARRNNPSGIVTVASEPSPTAPKPPVASVENHVVHAVTEVPAAVEPPMPTPPSAPQIAETPPSTPVQEGGEPPVAEQSPAVVADPTPVAPPTAEASVAEAPTAPTPTPEATPPAAQRLLLRRLHRRNRCPWRKRISRT